MAFKYVVAAATIAAAVAAPAIKPAAHEGKRLIATSDSQSAWMSEEEVFGLIRANKNFIDITEQDVSLHVAKRAFIPSTPTHQDIVKSLISQSDVERVRADLTVLSAFNNRYYQSTTGVESSRWILDTATEIARNRTGVTVESFAHSWAQPSVIARIPGTLSDETVILGAHQDSINGLSPANGRAPGADDDGSGSTTILEVFRTLINSGFVPERTVEIQWYAAEEVGLRGSQAIAQSYAAAGRNLVSQMQIDMDGFPGARSTIAVVTDYTDPEMSEWTRTLVDEYLTSPWINTVCGYGCSDHASWTAIGVPASFPFEADFDDINPAIHTANDDISRVDFTHVNEWIKLGLAYVVETSYSS